MTGRILVAGGVQEERDLLIDLLDAARYEVMQAVTADEVAEQALNASPDIIMLDERLGDGTGINLCRALRTDPRLRDLPIILSARRDDSEARRAALEAGANELLRKPHDEVVLMARVRSILRMRDTSEELKRRRTTAGEFGFAEPSATFAPPGRIAFVSPAGARAAEWCEALRPLVRHHMEVTDPVAALEQESRGRAADVYVLDASTGCATATLRLLADLRSRAFTRFAAIIFMAPTEDRDCRAMALDLGANDLIPADFELPELAVRLKSQLRRKREADALRAAVDEDLRLAVLDPLTGLYNRRYAMAHLKRVSSRAAETGRTFAVMVADIDRFKDINDRYGHAVGDAVLVEVARRLKDNLRGHDLVARIGGEEFLVALPECDLTEARLAGERLCRVIDAVPCELPSGISIHVTMSIGVSVGGGTKGLDVVASLIDAADRALYGSKSDGRNKVTMSRPAA
ncbi:diguanylate cyclase [Roseitranquillus sediminis]|uniref:diguanylate cyclase n=1 Tax=Roseitranquillus sediminis TaxID=2809051 RepID=UPI001D0C347F|nr:diguanylate cyclase [Roseitranquillus sediminis]MBM9593128.1 diguanylate cyclase [Roseitranquillus sediminis]